MGRNAWFHREILLLLAAMLGAFGRFAPIFYSEVDSEPEVFFSVLTRNGEVCSVDASVFSLVAQLALGKLDTTVTSFTWLRRAMVDKLFFRRSVRHFSASSSELRPGVSGLPIYLDDLWPYVQSLFWLNLNLNTRHSQWHPPWERLP